MSCKRRLSKEFSVDSHEEATNEEALTETRKVQELTVGECVIHLLAAGLHGSSRPDHNGFSELALGDMSELLNQARSGFEVIILDLGVISAGRQSALGAALSDLCVLVSASGAGKNEINASQDLLDRLKPAQYLLAFNPCKLS